MKCDTKVCTAFNTLIICHFISCVYSEILKAVLATLLCTFIKQTPVGPYN